MKLLICTQAVDINHPILGFFCGWVEEFAKHFDEVYVICLQKGEYHLPSHVHVYSLGKEEGENKLKYVFRFYTYFSKIFFSAKIDFVFLHMGAIYNILAAPFFFVRALFKTKFYWWKTHGTLTLLGRVALMFVDRVYTASSKSFPLTTKKKHVVGHAVPVVDTPFSPQPITDQPLLLFVGRVTPVKKIELVLETVKELESRGIRVTARIVGMLPDKEYEAKIRARIGELELEKLVTITGPKKYLELKDEYQKATVFINPSETGGIDKVVLEAMQYGIPVVALEETYGELLCPFGLAIRTQDSRLYADTIEKLITNTEWRQSLGSDLHAEIVSHHALSTLTNRIFNI